MKAKEIHKQWEKYYNRSTILAIVPTVLLVTAAYLVGCGFVHFIVAVGILILSSLICIILLAIEDHKKNKLINDPNNLSQFLEIIIDNYSEKDRFGKRRLNKQMMLASHLKHLLSLYRNQDDDACSKSRKELYEFIDNDLDINNEKQFLELCKICHNNQTKSEKLYSESNDNIDRSDITSTTFRFIVYNIKRGIFIFLLIALVLIIFVGCFQNIIDCIGFDKERFDLTNTIVFDSATVLLLFFEIKQGY